MRAEIMGVQFSIVNQEEIASFLLQHDYTNTNYICLPDLSVLVAAQKDMFLKHILNHSLMTLPDGKYIEYQGRFKGNRRMRTVSGYKLIRSLLESEMRHYFYGSDPHTISTLVRKIKSDYPCAIIVGYSSPPYLEVDEIMNNVSIEQDIQAINTLQPDIIWLGISSPKQDYLAYYYHTKLTHGLMIAVGGVFDYLAETHKISPEWIKKIGLRWLFRLINEPRRLWKKYLMAFIGYIKWGFNNAYTGMKSLFIKD